MAYENWGPLGPGGDPMMSLQGLGAYEHWSALGPGGDPAMSLQGGLGDWTRWGRLGPGGDPSMSLQGRGVGQPYARAGMVGPMMMSYVVPIVPAIQKLMTTPAYPVPSVAATTTAGLGQLTPNEETLGLMYVISSFTAAGLGAFIGWYHGGKRSGGKMGAKVGWGAAGFFLPVVTTGVAALQGFGKRG